MKCRLYRKRSIQEFLDCRIRSESSCNENELHDIDKSIIFLISTWAPLKYENSYRTKIGAVFDNQNETHNLYTRNP